MSLKDSLFSDDAEEDLQHFLRNEQRKRVLVFPPVNNYRRFLIHQLVQERFTDLQTFSIGQGFARRTVVCYKSDYIGPPKVDGVVPQTKNGFWTKYPETGAENHLSPNASPEHKLPKLKQTKSTPAYEIYRPPALRRARLEKSHVMEPRTTIQSEQASSDTSVNARANRPKRPDRAVYVPRHRRSIPEAECKNISDVQEPSIKSAAETARISPRRPLERNNLVKDMKTIEKRSKNSTIEIQSTEELDSCDELMDNSLPEQVISKEPRIDDSLYNNEEIIISENISINNDSVNKHYDKLISDSSKLIESISEEINGQKILEDAQTIETCDKMDQELNREFISTVNETMEQVSSDILMTAVEENMDLEISDDIPTMTLEEKMNENFKSNNESESVSLSESFEKANFKDVSKIDDEKQTVNDNLLETETAITETVKDSCVMDVTNNNETSLQESKSASNCQISSIEQVEKPVKQTLVSKVLIISTSDEKEPEVTEKPDPAPVIAPPEKKKVKKVEKPKIKQVSPPPPAEPVKKINRDECDWDSLFDDNGECLDPTLMEELTASVGEVSIEKPKSSYKAFKRPVEVSSDEYGHVIEIYNFPSEFKSSDIAAVFSPFKNGGFTLKWVDDTHCLGIFSSPVVAAEVLSSDHPFVKTRPLSEATPLSRSKAQKSAESLQPYRARPETCAALARRLVTKSLGVKLATAKQEREQEKIVLREAKEKRRLANKQRDDVWEGIIEKSTS